jgi:hypothetical protein
VVSLFALSGHFLFISLTDAGSLLQVSLNFSIWSSLAGLVLGIFSSLEHT